MFSWAKTETPANLSKKSKKVLEYVICYQKNKTDTKFTGIKKESQSSNGLLNQTNSINTLILPEVNFAMAFGRVKTSSRAAQFLDLIAVSAETNRASLLLIVVGMPPIGITVKKLVCKM